MRSPVWVKGNSPPIYVKFFYVVNIFFLFSDLFSVVRFVGILSYPHVSFHYMEQIFTDATNGMDGTMIELNSMISK